MGFEYQDVKIDYSNLNPNYKKKQQQQALQNSFQAEMIDFYVKVWPFIDLSSRMWKNSTKFFKGSELEFTFDIAFYDNDDQIQLSSGIPRRGIVS